MEISPAINTYDTIIVGLIIENKEATATDYIKDLQEILSSNFLKF